MNTSLKINFIILVQIIFGSNTIFSMGYNSYAHYQKVLKAFIDKTEVELGDLNRLDEYNPYSNKGQCTVLHHAVRNGDSVAFISFLCSKGADPLKTGKGMCFLGGSDLIESHSCQSSLEECLLHYQSVLLGFFYQKGYRLSDDSDTLTPSPITRLIYRNKISNGYCSALSILRILINNKHPLDIPDWLGKRPLFLCLEHNFPEFFDELLLSGADPFMNEEEQKKFNEYFAVNRKCTKIEIKYHQRGCINKYRKKRRETFSALRQQSPLYFALLPTPILELASNFIE